MKEKQQPESPDLKEVICFCFGVELGAIREAVKKNNYKGVEQITRYCAAGGGCHGCQPDIRRIIDEARQEFGLDQMEAEKLEQAEKKSGSLPAIKMIRLVEKAIQEKINPLLKNEQIQVSLDEVNGDIVILKTNNELSPSLLNDVEAILKQDICNSIELKII